MPNQALEPTSLNVRETALVIVRPSVERDSNAISELCIQLGYLAHAEQIEERLKCLLAQSSEYVAVAESEDGTVVGWIHVHLCVALESGLRAEILGLVVSEGSRRAGVGRELVAAAEVWAAHRGAPAVVVRSNVARLESHVFYPALGYVESKLQRVYRKVSQKP